MKTTLFVTATNTDVGKTYACETLLNKYAKDGKRVGYFKPLETGVDDIPLDGGSMFNLVKKLNPLFDVSIDDVVPYQFKLPAAPYVANSENIIIDIEYIKEKINYLLKFCDILIIEGAGGLMVPIKKEYFIVDLIKDLEINLENFETVLVVPSNLGSINDNLLSQNILKQYEIKYKWCINLYKDKDSFETTTLPFYKDYFNDEIGYL